VRKFLPLLCFWGCSEPEPVDPPPSEDTCSLAVRSPLRRLSRLEMQGVLHTLSSELNLGPVEALALDQLVDALPVDSKKGLGSRGGLKQLDQDVVQAHAEAWLGVAVLAAEVIAPHVGSWQDCDPAAPACAWRVVDALAPVLHRRPLSGEHRSELLGTFELLGMQDMLAHLLGSPFVPFHVEEPLDDWALAARLAFHLTAAPPDHALRAVVEGGQLDEKWDAEARRLAASERGGVVVEAFAEDWLWLDELPDLISRKGTGAYDAALGDLVISGATSRDLRAEIQTLVRYHVVDAPSSFSDLLLSPYHVSANATVSKIYGMDPWRDGGTPPSLSDRRGLLTRAAWLVSGTPETRPIHKGVRLREALLCAPLGAPPDNAAAQPPEPVEGQSTRETTHQLTRGSCASCHDQINPLGFVTEGFDAFGRARTSETLWGEDGEALAQVALDTTGSIFLPGVGETAFAGPEDLQTAIDTSGAAHRCFAETVSQWAYQQLEPPACLIEDLSELLIAGEPLDEAWVRVALQPAFRGVR